MSYFRLTYPEGPASPVLVEVPHGGLEVPDVVAAEISAHDKAVLRDSDIFVDKLCEGITETGASLLVAHVSRYVVDLNRAPDDIDLDTGRGPNTSARGVVWHAATDGTPILKGPLTEAQFRRRIELFHEPYHRALCAEVDRIRARHGHMLIVAVHSMPSVGRSLDGSAMVRRADVVPGTRGGTSADMRVIALVERHFLDAGLSVARDEPYQGGWTTAHYGRPEHGVHAIQLELNRALYVDEPTVRIKQPGFDALREMLFDLVDRLGRLELD